jgi:hypothetical protein
MAVLPSCDDELGADDVAVIVHGEGTLGTVDLNTEQMRAGRNISGDVEVQV